jgi:hypothetical protein
MTEILEMSKMTQMCDYYTPDTVYTRYSNLEYSRAAGTPLKCV